MRSVRKISTTATAIIHRGLNMEPMKKRLRHGVAGMAVASLLAASQALAAVTVTPLHHFAAGQAPRGSVILGSNGKLHGLSGNMTVSTSSGISWQLDTTGSNFSSLPFPATLDVQMMTTNLVTGGNGRFFGAIYTSSTVSGSGVPSDQGSLFRFGAGEAPSISPVPSTSPIIFRAVGNMAADVAGNVYVMDRGTAGTGVTAAATIRRLSSDESQFTIVKNFVAADGTSLTALIAPSDGWLYGLASTGGSSNYGTVFRLRPDGSAFEVLHNFAAADGQPGVASVGSYSGPIQYSGRFNSSSLIEVGDWLYGTAYNRSTASGGSVYRLKKDGSGFQVLHAFNDSVDQKGRYPLGMLVYAQDGNVYGTTSTGGANGNGTLWRIVTADAGNADGGFEHLHDFKAAVDGSSALNLSPGKDGRLYGLMLAGGDNNAGTLVEIDTGYRPPAEAPVMHAFFAAPDPIMLGASVVLSWSTSYVDGCTASGAWSGNKAATGYEVVVPATPGPQQFTLSCTGSFGTVEKTASITVTPQPSAVISRFVATPNKVSIGGVVTLDWTTADADYCQAASSNWDGTWVTTQAASGSKSVVPASVGDHTYSLFCHGPGGDATHDVTVTVTIPAALDFTASAASVAPGGSVTLTWAATDAVSCLAEGAWSGVKATSGSETVTPGAGGQLYLLRCFSANDTDAVKSLAVVAGRVVDPDADWPDEEGGSLPPFLLVVMALAGVGRRWRRQQ